MKDYSRWIIGESEIQEKITELPAHSNDSFLLSLV